jgi:hypothetical protein
LRTQENPLENQPGGIAATDDYRRRARATAARPAAAIKAIMPGSGTAATGSAVSA